MLNEQTAKVKIFYTDLDDPEKADTFRDLFGEKRYKNVLSQISEQVYGDGKLDKLAKMAAKADDETYENELRPLIQKEQARLKPKDEAFGEITLKVHETFHNPAKRQKAINYLGKQRYFKALDLENIDYANSKSLLDDRINPNVQSYEARQRAEAQKVDEALRQQEAEREKMKEEAKAMAENMNGE